VADAYGRSPDLVQDFAERFAAMMVDGGVPRMAARVLAQLYTADTRSLTAPDLVRSLRVSPASISKAVGYLEQVGMIHREPDPRRRLQHYIIAEDVWTQAWKVSARTNLNWAETAAEGAGLLGPGTPAGVRLTKMADFFHRLGEDMAGGPSFELIDDAFTVLAALLHATRPLTADELAAALDWPTARITDALANATKYAEYTDPVVLDQPTSDTYTAVPTPTRLTPGQLASLR
jgi:DNA-binding transcriptional regulator GbsR (MarR family)